MEIDEKQFTYGFNSGYFLAKFEPELLTKLMVNIQPLNSYVQGLALGRKEYGITHSNKELGELDRLRQKGKEERNFERD